MYLADTTYLIDLVKGDRGAEKLAKIIDDEDTRVSIAGVTVQEYLRGIYYLFVDSEEFDEKLHMAETDLARFTIIDFTYSIAKLAAEIDAKLTKMGEQIGIADVQIAATCIHFDLILISRNIKHFKRLTKLKVKTY